MSLILNFYKFWVKIPIHSYGKSIKFGEKFIIMPKTILIVDDFFTNRLAIRNVLKNYGFNNVEAKNGKDAIDIIKTQAIDMVLMDIEMPVMNGLDALKHIKAMENIEKRNLPIIAITAHQAGEIKEYTQKGFDGVITKPFSIDKLKDILPQWFS